MKLGSGIGPHFRPKPGNVRSIRHHALLTYSIPLYGVCRTAYAVTDAGYAIAPRGSSVVPRPGLADDSSILSRQFALAAEVIALLVDLHGFFVCIGGGGDSIVRH